MKTEAIRALATLGLTTSEATVYLTLAKLEKADAKTIYKSSAVARQDIYRILAQLQEKGLVERLVVIPAEFKPVPIEWCVSILVKRIRNKLSENEKAATNALKKLKKENFENALPEEESNFVVTPKNKEIFSKKVREMLENSRKSMDIIITAKRFNYVGALFEGDFKRALERGVKFQIITELIENENLPSKGLKALMQHPFFNVRYVPGKVPTPAWQADNKRMFIVTSSIINASSEVSTFWTNNSQIVAGFHSYFKLLWNTQSLDAPIKAS